MISTEFLERVLACLIKDSDFADRFLVLIPSELFNNAIPVHERAWAVLKAHEVQYRELPGMQTLLESMINLPPEGWSKPSDEEVIDIVDFLERVDRDDLSNKQWLVDNLHQEMQRIEVSRLLSQAVPMLTESDPATFKEGLIELNQNINNALTMPFETDLGHGMVADLDERIERRKIFESIPNQVIPTQLGPLDTSLDHGGVPMKSLCILAARTNKGKSVGLAHLAKSAFLTDFPVLMITLELSGHIVQDRLDASLSRTTMSTLSEESETIRQKYGLWKSKHNGSTAEIQVVEEIPRSFSISKLNNLLDRLRREKHFEPRLICLDYADLMKMERKYSNRYEELEDLFVCLGGVARERNLVLWTASQVNRAGEGLDYADTVHLSGSDGKAATSDLVLTINPSDRKVAKPNEVRVMVAKNRIGTICEPFLLYQDLSSMQFTIDAPSL